jgi:hypothetical protein
MLGRRLDSHPEITMSGELEFTVAYDPAAVQDMGPVYQELLYYRGYWSHDVGPRFSGDYATDMRAFVNDIGRLHGTRVAGGAVHFHLDRLVKIWPEAKFVRIVRDVRDVYASARAMGIEGNAWSVATSWVREEQCWDRLAPSLGPAQAFLVRYEDLVRDPERETQRIFEFLGCDPDATLSADVSGWGSREPFTTSISRGRRNARTSNYVLEAIAGRELEARGYQGGRGPRSELLVRILSPLMAWHDKLWRRRVAINSYGLLVLAVGFLARRLRLKRLARLTRLVVVGRDEESIRLARLRYARSRATLPR